MLAMSRDDELKSRITLMLREVLDRESLLLRRRLFL